MQKTVIYTFPFVFQRFPKDRPTLSRLQKGPNDQFGIAIEPIVDYETRTTTCSFFEVDVIKKRASHTKIDLPYVNIFEMWPCYDWSRNTWVIAVEGGIFNRPLDVYEISHNVRNSWRKIFAASSLDQNNQVGRALIALWQQGDYYPLVFSEIDTTDIQAQKVFSTHWRPLDAKKSGSQYISTTYHILPYVYDEGCLFFTCQCSYDDLVCRSIYGQAGSGQWQIQMVVYQNNGTLRHQSMFPDISLPIRDLLVAKDDLSHWLKVQMRAIAGPIHGPEEKATCVAVLVMQDNPGFIRMRDRHHYLLQHEPLKPQGGLYWIDAQGHILQHDSSTFGEQISICLCGQTVVGTHLVGVERYVWSWSLLDGGERKYHTLLLSGSKRVALVAMEKQKAEQSSYFWCVEEYETSMRISQWETSRFQEMRVIWCEGIRFPDTEYGPYLSQRELQWAIAYQDTLLLLIINQENQLQLLQIK